MSDVVAVPDSSVWTIPIDLITVPENRQRDNAEADATLVASIERDGLLNPIVVHALDGDYVLVAGERRLDAHRRLGRTTIRAGVLEQMPPKTAMRIELTENLARKQLSWQQEVGAVASYHTLCKAEYAGWTQAGTASDLGMSQANVSKYLAVAECMDDEEVRECPTLQGAFNRITAIADRARVAAQSRGLDVGAAAAISLPPPIPADASKEERTAILLRHAQTQTTIGEVVASTPDAIERIRAGKIAEAALAEAAKTEVQNDLIINADAVDWMADYTGPKFDVLHCDFPYGINYTGSRTRKTGKSHVHPVYADDPDVYWTLLDSLLEHQDRLVYGAAHCIFWFDMRFYQATVDAFEAAGWKLVQPHPLIWTKGYQGVASDPLRRPRHCYETALLLSRGDRKITKLDKDHFEAQVDEKLHINQKPLGMLRHFLSLVVDQHTAVLDPTCGSGTSLAAAAQLRCSRFLGVELDPANADIARFMLQRHAPDSGGSDGVTP